MLLRTKRELQLNSLNGTVYRYLLPVLLLFVMWLNFSTAIHHGTVTQRKKLVLEDPSISNSIKWLQLSVFSISWMQAMKRLLFKIN